MVELLMLRLSGQGPMRSSRSFLAVIDAASAGIRTFSLMILRRARQCPAHHLLVGRVFASKTAFSRSYTIHSGTVASAPRDVFTAADQSHSFKLPVVEEMIGS